MTVKNILLIDKRVQEYETIKNATDPERCIPILFDYFTDTVDDIKERILESCVSDDEDASNRCIGLIQHNYNTPLYHLVSSNTNTNSNGGNSSIITGVQIQDPELATWAPLYSLIEWCVTAPEIRATYFDMMACALYSNPEWKYIIDTMETQIRSSGGDVTIRASTDNTGSATLGGNWYLESHTGVNLKTVYFTEAIDDYKGLLYVYIFNIKDYQTKGPASGSVLTWGADGGNSSSVSASLSSDVVAVYSTSNAFAALKSNGSVITWGGSGGDSSSVSASLTSGVIAIYSTESGFAALKNNGSVITWGSNGGNSSSVSASLTSGVVAIFSTIYAFAALKSDGSVVTWGDSLYGGRMSVNISITPNVGDTARYVNSISSLLTSNVAAIYSNYYAFAALKTDGRLVAWGYSDTFVHPHFFINYGYGGDIYSQGSTAGSALSSGIISAYFTNRAGAAIKTTSTVFDLSMSYYSDMDRYDILRRKENRRIVNLTLLNNNIFTLSKVRDIQTFNPSMPTDKILRIIVPDYNTSIYSSLTYSITSTATLIPGSIHYIIACDEAEPVNISGVTLVNYGTFVYRLETDNTYTKLTYTVINGKQYYVYGGDGINSSGIALVTLYPSPTLSNFPNITKVSNAPPFQITPPTSNSSAGFSYTSSNTLSLIHI